MTDMTVLSADGYDALANVLHRAFEQASAGKGKERHANGKPFTEQPMLSINRTLGSIDGMLYQAAKKSAEARGLPTTERAVAELLGAINYLAGAVILLEEGMLHGKSSITSNTSHEGWIAYDGKNRPSGPEEVRVRCRDGSETSGSGWDFYWESSGGGSDIVAYKLL